MNATLLPDPEDPRVPITKMLPGSAVQTARSEADKAMKLRVAGRFVEFMASKGLDKIALWDLNAHHVSEWLDHVDPKFKLAHNGVRTYSRRLGTLFKEASSGYRT